MTDSLPPAVVMGLSPTGLHAIRSLGRAGVPVYGVGAAPHAGSASRYLRGRMHHPDPQARIAWVAERAHSAPGMVVIPTSDEDLAALIDALPTLGNTVSVPGAYRDGLARDMLDKAAFYRHCAAQGQDYPALHEGQADRIAALADSLDYPCFVKPASIHLCKAAMRGRKGWIARDPDHLRALLGDLPQNVGALLVQRIVSGPESQISLYCGYIDGAGRPQHGFTAAKLRQWPPGFGSASRVQSTDDPETRAAAEDFLTAIGYRGIAAVEFKRDPQTGRLTMIEVNARPSLWFEAAAAAGCDPVLAAYHDLAATGRAPAQARPAVGVQWRYGGKDLCAAGFYAVARDFVLPAPDLRMAGPVRARVRAVFARDDWRPALSEAWALGRKALTRLSGGAHAN